MKDLILTSSVLILAILLIRFLFRRTISRRVQYALWLVVLLRLLVPVSIGGSSWSVASVADQMPGREMPETVLTVVGGEVPSLSVREPDPSLPEAEQQVLYQEYRQEWKDAVDRSRLETGGTPITVRGILSLVWYAGMAVMALWLFLANLRFARRLWRTQVPLEGVVSKYPVYLCDDIPSPCLFGLFRPAIYVTSEAARDPARLRCVIAHEETHGRHLDPLWALLRSACLVLWWFHPLVWLAACCSRVDCELACDEGTLARLGEEERIAYGETLLALIPRRSVANPVVTATTMTAGGRQMKNRIQRIAEHRKPVVIALALALTLAAAACAVTFTGAAKRTEGQELPSLAPTETYRPAPVSESSARVLTGAELEYFNERFFSQGKPGVGQLSIHNQFLPRTYASPEDIDLYELFYSGVGIDYHPLSDEEFRLVGSNVTGTHKYPADELDAVFFANTGLHIDETKKIGLNRFTYLEEYDAYYDTHGDTNYCSQIWINAGTREGDLVRLWYELDGWCCVTLRDMGNGVWHFISNLPAEKPTIPTALPEGEPWAVIPLDGLEPSELPPVTLSAPEQFPRRSGGWQANDADVVVRLVTAQDGTASAAVEEGYENGVTTARRFFTFPADARNPGVTGFSDLFGYDRGLIVYYGTEIAHNTYGNRCHYYSFAADGTPTLAAEIPIFGDLPQVSDLDGDGTNELVSAGWNEAWLCFQREGTAYCAAPVCALLQPYLGDATIYGTGFDANYRCLSVAGVQNGRHILFYLYFDGERLLVYKEPAPRVTDHVREGVKGPPEVLAAALAKVRAQAANLTARMERGESTWAPDYWCVSSLDYTVTARGDWSIETWRVSAQLHASDPDKVVWAGGTHVTEYGWVVGMYDPEPYLFFLLSPDGTRRQLVGSVSFEYGPGNAVMFPVVLDYIELRNGLRGPERIEGVSLWRMFHLCGAAETLNAIGTAEEAVRADALRRLADGAVDCGEWDNLSSLLNRSSGVGTLDILTDSGRAALEELQALAGL